MKNNITTIITLYKTPFNKLKNLKQYNSFNLKIFEQEGSLFLKKKLQKILNRKFDYIYSSNNIGLPKASNILLKKVKSKYLLFTQADILINKKSVIELVKIFKKDKDIIFVTPSMNTKIYNNSKKNNLSYVKNIKAACMVCDVKKLKKIGFFDEDFFLYWEDIDLIERINNSKFKMVTAKNIFAKHQSSQSSEYSIKTQYLRNSNYIYGEFVYDLKHNKLRLLKILRMILKNFILFFYDLLILKFKRSLLRLYTIIGVFKFIQFYIIFKIFK